MEDENVKIKRKIKETLKYILIGILIGIVASFLLSLIGRNLFSSSSKEVMKVKTVDTSKKKTKEQKITVEYVSKKLEKISELTTAELIYNGLYTVSEGKIPFITKKGFSMTYTATVKAGIDVSLMDIDVTDSEVKIAIPEAEIQTTWIDPDSIQFYDEKFALFNWSEKEDVTDAISAAEQNVNEKADVDGLMERASFQAEYVIKGLLEGSIEEKRLVVEQKEN